MNSAILVSPKVLEINRKAQIPEPGPGEVVVKVRSALTCGTDIKTYLRGHPMIPLPSPLGHEFSGDIFKVGEGVEGFPVGTPIMAVHSAPCGECSFCRMGRENLCRKTMEEKVLGAYAEYVLLPAHIVKKNLFIKPESLSYTEAAMLEPLSCVVHGMKAVSRAAADTVMIMGAGPIGLLLTMLYKSRGARVIVAGRKLERLEVARDLGADVIVDSKVDDLPWTVIEATDGAGADLVIEAAGSKELWEVSPSLVRKGGTVLLFGGCPSDTKVCFDASRLHYDEISLVGAFHFTPTDVREAYGLLVSDWIDTKKLVSGTYPLDKLQEAFDRLVKGDGIKYEIIP